MLNVLNDTKIRSISSNGRTQHLFDGGGLYLEVSPKGGRWWRMKYSFLSKEKRISLGVYPDVPLKLARERAGEARKQLALLGFPIKDATSRCCLDCNRQSGHHRFQLIACLQSDGCARSDIPFIIDLNGWMPRCRSQHQQMASSRPCRAPARTPVSAPWQQSARP
jgi:hypothetical protein